MFDLQKKSNPMILLKIKKHSTVGRVLFEKYFNDTYFTSINSTSKTRVASGGITPPAPALPYPK